jgi:NADH dehydrogenase
MRLVIAGGGFAGFWAAAAAARLRRETPSLASLEILLISRDDRLVIRPRLYEPDPSSMSVALAPRLAAIGVEFRPGEVASIDVAGSTLRVGQDEIPHDKLVLTTGSHLARPTGVLDSQGFDIDTLEGAANFDRHLRELSDQPESAGRWTVVIAGGGFTGIELATALPRRIREIVGTAAIRVIVVDLAARVGASLGDGPKSAIGDALAAAGIEVRTAATIAGADSNSVVLSTGERIACRTLVWTTGMRASPLAAQVAGQTSAQTDSLGRVPVSAQLRVAGTKHVFAAGDVAHAVAADGHAILQSCQHAQVTGRFAGHNAAADLAGMPLQVYRQPFYTTCLDLGESGAVLTTGWDRLVQATGDRAKEIKRRINTQFIYPPMEQDAILAAAAPSVMEEESFRRRILAKAT